MFAPARATLLHRKCACGGSPGPDGECAACRAKRLGLQRRAASPAAPALAPPVVHDVLRSPGRPLDAATRTFMEPRFGHDFGRVRVHTDARAAQSAHAVGALAYTVGQSVIFGAGQYRPQSADGRRLLAHELAHVVQQGNGNIAVPQALSVGPSNDPAEREADAQAAQVVQGLPVTAASGLRGRPTVQRDARQPNNGPGPAPAPPASGAPAPSFVCGPDVTQQVKDVVADIRAAWAGWTTAQREESCWALEDGGCGPVAWDVVQLHNNAWIYQDYRPACASAGAHPLCGSSVKVGSDCHNAGSVNYVIFGVMCDLCGIWRKTMHAMIFVHKAHLGGMDPDYDAALDWAVAGYHGWPSAPTPGGDRNNCAPTCPTPYGPTANNGAARFDFHWFPAHTTEGVGSDCPKSLDFYRHAPNSGIFGYG